METGLFWISSLLDISNKPLQGDQNSDTAARSKSIWYFTCQQEMKDAVTRR